MDSTRSTPITITITITKTKTITISISISISKTTSISISKTKSEIKIFFKNLFFCFGYLVFGFFCVLLKPMMRCSPFANTFGSHLRGHILPLRHRKVFGNIKRPLKKSLKIRLIWWLK